MTENDHIANLSRLMDEDLDYQADQGECGELIDALCENPRLRGKLCRYQLLRDFMRNRLPAHPAPTHFSAMVMQEINAKRAVGKTNEQFSSEPQPVDTDADAIPALQYPRFSFALAASLMLVVGLLVVQFFPESKPSIPEGASPSIDRLVATEAHDGAGERAIAAPAVDEAGGQRTIAQQSAEAKNKWMSLPNQVVFSSSVSSEYSDNGATIGNYAELSRDVNPAAMDLPMDLYRLKYAQSRYQTSFLGISPHARLGLIGIDNQ